ncbi:hypothetical protein PR048_024649 [Dryococelus australis]|uniref:Uncharacterized protein n=1 Tax=Dryococelus australis TaxID=614101 RepID=A0ABQ9GP56_9NEOP|nr:hypothetical protein PR048_024649 [Dryococelus australis]
MGIVPDDVAGVGCGLYDDPPPRPTLAFRRCSNSPHFTLIGSQDSKQRPRSYIVPAGKTAQRLHWLGSGLRPRASKHSTRLSLSPLILNFTPFHALLALLQASTRPSARAGAPAAIRAMRGRLINYDINISIGVAVAERLSRSLPTKASRVQAPAGSPDCRIWESCRTMPLVSWFSRGSLVSSVLSFRRCSILTSITLIGSQDLALYDDKVDNSTLQQKADLATASSHATPRDETNTEKTRHRKTPRAVCSRAPDNGHPRTGRWLLSCAGGRHERIGRDVCRLIAQSGHSATPACRRCRDWRRSGVVDLWRPPGWRRGLVKERELDVSGGVPLPRPLHTYQITEAACRYARLRSAVDLPTTRRYSHRRHKLDHFPCCTLPISQCRLGWSRRHVALGTEPAGTPRRGQQRLVPILTLAGALSPPQQVPASRSSADLLLLLFTKLKEDLSVRAFKAAGPCVLSLLQTGVETRFPER